MLKKYKCYKKHIIIENQYLGHTRTLWRHGNKIGTQFLFMICLECVLLVSSYFTCCSYQTKSVADVWMISKSVGTFTTYEYIHIYYVVLFTIMKHKATSPYMYVNHGVIFLPLDLRGFDWWSFKFPCRESTVGRSVNQILATFMNTTFIHTYEINGVYVFRWRHRVYRRWFCCAMFRWKYNIGY